MDVGLEHLVVSGKDIQLGLRLIPGIFISYFEGELLVVVVAFYDCYHFLYFGVLDAEHAESGGVELEAENVFV